MKTYEIHRRVKKKLKKKRFKDMIGNIGFWIFVVVAVVIYYFFQWLATWTAGEIVMLTAAISAVAAIVLGLIKLSERSS